MRLVVTLAALLVAWTAAAQTMPPHPHEWIKRFRAPGAATNCCGGADCVPVPLDEALGLSVGDTMNLPAVGYHPSGEITVKGIFPTPPGEGAWGCHTGCLFLPMGV